MNPLELDDYQHIVFFTGAGLSAEAGIPTYRGAGGTWAKYDYRAYACQRAFDGDPAKVWDFHDERRLRMASAEPAAAHRMIAAAQATHPSVAIITQNIDGLHQRAGAHHVIELHGSIWRVRCRCPGAPQVNLEAPIAERLCPTCGVWRRPDIVWFEDPLQPAPIQQGIDAIAACDLLISIGTSGVVYPAAELPRAAAQRGARCIEINPEPTAVSEWYDTHLRTGASDALRSLLPDLATGGTTPG